MLLKKPVTDQMSIQKITCFKKDSVTDLLDELSQLEDPKRYQSAYDKQKMHPTLATKEELKRMVQMTENKEGKL